MQAHDGAAIQPGIVYVAQTDKHLVLEEGRMRVTVGPKENRFRPAIDPLFRSAALVYGSRVVGVILTGLLDDGSSGLLSIKKAGGLAIVQHPDDAMYSSMPLSALKLVKVDYSVPISEMAEVFKKVVEIPAPKEIPMKLPKRVQLETDIVKMDGNAMDKTREIGKPAGLACPTCHGALWEIDDESMLRYRCHVGHAYTATTLQADQIENIEDKLWGAIAAADENILLLRRMAEENIGIDEETREKYEKQARKTEENIKLLRAIVAQQQE
jgi:two-component system chemotaxis response regulator CheB